MSRYQFTWSVLRFIVGRTVSARYRYKAEICDARGPLLVLANHNTDCDPIFLSMAFPRFMHYVASEHIFRWGFAARALNWLFAPISRMKGTTAGDTAMAMMRTIRRGGSVAMFAEGNRSFNGVTGEILPATGKLARSSGATLVTYRIEGGYFTSPRWCGSKMRRGRMRGRVVGVYPPETLRAMKPGEVNALICRDLDVDAYELQRREPVAYRGKNLAEHLETVFCLCPACGALGTLRSHGDVLDCSCGFSVKYNAYGFIEGEDAPFDNITDWDRSQTEKLLAMTAEDGKPFFSDGGMELREVLPGHKDCLLASGDIALYPGELVCCGHRFPIDEISGMALHGAQSLDFTCGGWDYEVSSPEIRCTRKYMLKFRQLKAAI